MSWIYYHISGKNAIARRCFILIPLGRRTLIYMKLRTKIKIPQNQRFHGIFDGRSDWIRTSGHLNPIQVLYQTEPHPDVAIRCACSLSCKQESLTCSAIAPYSQKRKRFREPCGQIPPLVRFHASAKVSSAAGLLLIPKNASVFGSSCAVFLRQF